MNAMTAKTEKDYFENMGIRNPLLWLVLIALLLFFTFASLAQIVLKMPIGDNPMPNWALVAGTIFIAFITVLMAQTRLSTSINSEGIEINFGALGQHQLSWKEIKKVSIKRPPLSGIGKRQRGPQQIIYNVGAKTSLCIELKEDLKIWVSTRNESNLKAYLKEIKKLKA